MSRRELKTVDEKTRQQKITQLLTLLAQLDEGQLADTLQVIRAFNTGRADDLPESYKEYERQRKDGTQNDE